MEKKQFLLFCKQIKINNIKNIINNVKLETFGFHSKQNMCDESACNIYIEGNVLAKPTIVRSTKAFFFPQLSLNVYLQPNVRFVRAIFTLLLDLFTWSIFAFFTRLPVIIFCFFQIIQHQNKTKITLFGLFEKPKSHFFIL